MILSDHSVRLPAELLAKIFDHFHFIDLLPVLGVCARWRAMALDSRAYWYGIFLSSATLGCLNLFLARLERAKGRPIYLNIRLTQPIDVLSTAVLPALTEHLHHIQYLSLTVAGEAVPDLFERLRRPAPLLVGVFLSIHLPTLETPSPILPLDIFSDTPSALRAVRLENVQLPELWPRAPGAFAAVTSVRFACTQGRTVMAPNLFAHFPCMWSLAFYGAVIPRAIEYAFPETVARIVWLTIALGGFTGTWMAFMPLAALPHIRVGGWSDEMVRFLDHLPASGALQAAFYDESADSCVPGLFTLSVGDLAWRVSRSFVDQWAPWLERSASARFLENAGVSTRLVSLTIPHCVWRPALCALPASLPALTQLRVVLSGAGLAPDPASGLLLLPRLQCLVLRSPFCVARLTRAAVLRFVRNALAPSVQLPLQTLALENASLSAEAEDLQQLGRYFRAIEPGGLGPWNYPVDIIKPNGD